MKIVTIEIFDEEEWAETLRIALTVLFDADEDGTILFQPPEGVVKLRVEQDEWGVSIETRPHP